MVWAGDSCAILFLFPTLYSVKLESNVLRLKGKSFSKTRTLIHVFKYSKLKNWWDNQPARSYILGFYTKEKLALKLFKNLFYTARKCVLEVKRPKFFWKYLCANFSWRLRVSTFKFSFFFELKKTPVKTVRTCDQVDQLSDKIFDRL